MTAQLPPHDSGLIANLNALETRLRWLSAWTSTTPTICVLAATG